MFEHTYRTAIVMMAIVALTLPYASAESQPPAKFVNGPTATKSTDGQVKIDFQLDQATDVAVYILDAKGEIVRHLAAGVLGKNAPEPLKADALAQSLVWDGKDDDGKPAAGGPFKVRVAAGLGVKFAGYPLAQDDVPYNQFGSIEGLGAAPDGGVYALMLKGGLHVSYGYRTVQRFTSKGEYAGTVMPFPGNLPADRVRAHTRITDEHGRPLLTYVSPNTTHGNMPYTPTPLVQDPVVLDNGNLLYAVQGSAPRGTKGTAIGWVEICPDGSVPGETLIKANSVYSGTMELVWASYRLSLAMASDGKGVFLAGAMAKRGGPAIPAVFLGDRQADGELKVIFGDSSAAGADQAHLSNPTSVATDGKGKLFVADSGNNRVVVVEESGKWVGSFEVENPLWVAVHAKTGCIYVYSHGKAVQQLLKFSPWPAPKAQAKMELKYTGARPVLASGWTFALARGAEPAQVWMGHYCQTEYLFHLGIQPTQMAFLTDQGDHFSDVTGIGSKDGPLTLWFTTSDPTHRYVTFNNGLMIDDRTGKVDAIRKSGGTPYIDRDGLIYGLPNSGNLRRYDRTGKEVPFAAVKPGNWIYRRDENGRLIAAEELPKGARTAVGGAAMGATVEWPGIEQSLPVCPSGTTGCERDLDIDRQGNIYVKNRTQQYHGEMTVDVYDHDGKYLRTAIWELGDEAYGPRIDAKGNMFFAMGVAAPTGNAPEMFSSLPYYQSLYGSLTKFTPKGGRLNFLSDAEYETQFGFKRPNLDSLGLSKEKVCVNIGPRDGRAKDKLLEGAVWWKPGYSACVLIGRGGNYCHCLGNAFDVDDFGRIFHPDTMRHQVVVLDTNGNLITRFGGYGNWDNRGPLSWVKDPQTGVLRPRRPDDSAGLKSPYDGTEEISFAYLNSVAVAEQHIYTTDVVDQRVTRIRMNYAADVNVDVK